MPPRLTEIGRVAARALLRSDPDPVGRMRWRVHLRYVDVNLHMNYASYLEVLELARWRWGLRNGMFRRWLADGLRPVVGSLEIAYHRELAPLQRFVVESRAVGFERRALVVDQRILVGEREHTSARLNVLLLQDGRPAAPEVVQQACDGFVVPPIG